jgi:cysteine-rich repeat protein
VDSIPECNDNANKNACRTTCKLPSCGDGVADVGEDCDLGADNDDTKPCTSHCKNAKCGDGLACTEIGCTSGPGGKVEGCDDGNTSNNDACLNTCAKAKCGDGIVCSDPVKCSEANHGPGVETCDDGNLDNSDGCTTECKAASCGDGVVQPMNGEQCDNGNALCTGGSNAEAVCKVASDCLGACAEDSVSPDAPCSSKNADLVCGDALKCNNPDPGTCDDTKNRDDMAGTCRTTCLKAKCGDGMNDDGPAPTGEQCDDGNAGNNDTCVISLPGQPANSDLSKGAPNCRTATCGDGVICSDAACKSGPDGKAEECDNGLLNSDTKKDACRVDCSTPTCGDGVKDSNEQCDDGLLNSDTKKDACRTTCKLPSCGDDVIDTNEDCDNGPDNGDNKPCTSQCKNAECGDQLVCNDPSCTSGPGSKAEQCDNGFHCVGGTVGPGTPCTVAKDCGPGGSCTNAGNGCDVDCKLAKCGDGHPDVGEQCDDGNRANGDDCDSDCVTEECGNGKVQYGENCDDGNAVSGDGCDDTCHKEFCGDGKVNNAGKEECDDALGNSNTTPDACRMNCKLAHCGDGVIDDTEQCDKGGVNTADCNADCTTPKCGDGKWNTAAGEECDWGTTLPCTGPSNGTSKECNDADPAVNQNSCRFDCTEPVCGDLIVDGGFAEQCDKGPAGDDTCTKSCCEVSNTSYSANFAGATCQTTSVAAACDLSTCKRGKRVNAKVKSLGKTLVRAQMLAANGRTFAAQRLVLREQRRTQQFAITASRFCPQSQACLTAQVAQLRFILIKLEGTLALGQL